MIIPAINGQETVCLFDQFPALALGWRHQSPIAEGRLRRISAAVPPVPQVVAETVGAVPPKGCSPGGS